MVDAYKHLWKANGRPPTQRNVVTFLSSQERVNFDPGTLMRALGRDFGWRSWQDLIERVDLD